MDRIQEQAQQILAAICDDPQFAPYVDKRLSLPQPFRGTGDIRLIILGQDPTVKDAAARAKIQTVLNLDRNGSVRAYVARICLNLGLRLTEHVYATNLYKNFFIRPPTQITEVNIFQLFADKWLSLLQTEVNQFGNLPVITLGEPLLAPLAHEGTVAKVGEYWGYTTEWASGKLKACRYIPAYANVLNRNLFPFPHQPSLRKPFYKSRLQDYSAFVKRTAF
jgi:hypothetical protein